MLRLALISVADPAMDRLRTDLQQACARLRGIELTVATTHSNELEGHHLNRFDAVVVRGPIEQQVDLTYRFASSGKHILLSGPMAHTLDEADHLIACCRNANVQLMIGGTIRFQPSITTIKAALESKQLGIPALLRSHSWRASESRTPSEAATQLFQQLDLAGWIFRTLPTEVYATAHHDRTETLQIHFGFPAGGMALMTICESLPPGNRYCSCSLIGSMGAAYSDDHRQMQLLYQGNSPRAERTTEGITSQVEELREFAEAIKQNREPSVSGADGRQAVLLTQAVRHSIELHQPLRLEGGSYVPIN